MAKATGRGSDQFNLRLPDGMRDQIAEAAQKSGRSMNAEIVHRLSNSLGRNGKFEDDALGLGDEELDWELMVLAEKNNRSLKEELIYRLKLSLRAPDFEIIHKLENIAHYAERRYEQLLELVTQLTPGERIRLEERASVVSLAKMSLKEKSNASTGANKNHLSPQEVDEFVKLNPVTNPKRFYLKMPAMNFGPLFRKKEKDQNSAKWHIILDDKSRHELKLYKVLHTEIADDTDDSTVKRVVIDGPQEALSAAHLDRNVFLEDPDGKLFPVAVFMEHGDWLAVPR